jgi:hypothetical protein
MAVARILDTRRTELETDPALGSPAAWNLGRERARSALEAIEARR